MVVNIDPVVMDDGILYSDDVPLTSTEANLYGGDGVQGTNPIQTVYGAAIIATIQLSINGIVVGNNSYVVLQQDLGEGVWIDLNWAVWTGNQGTATFVFSNGVAGANTIQQTRQSGGFPNPQAIGSNQLCLGGRLRFVGRSVFVGGSSSVAGITTSVSAAIRYKLLGLR